MAFRCLVGMRKLSGLSSMGKLNKFFCTTPLTPNPNRQWGAFLNTEEMPKDEVIHVCDGTPSTSAMTPCVKDENGCFEGRIVRKALAAVQQYNKRHNTKFEFSRVLRAVDYAGNSTITIEVKDGDMPQLYKVKVSGEDDHTDGYDPKGKDINDLHTWMVRGIRLLTWRTVDRADYDNI